VPHVLSIEQTNIQRIDPRTPRGIYNAVLAETDSKELAEQVAMRVANERAMARMTKQGSPL